MGGKKKKPQTIHQTEQGHPQQQPPPQQTQPSTQQQAPQAQAGPSSGSSRPGSGKNKGKKQQQAQQAQQQPPPQQTQPSTQQQAQAPPKQQPPQGQPGASGDSRPSSGKGKGKKPQQQPQPERAPTPQQSHPQRPVEIPVQTAWQKGGPQQQHGPRGPSQPSGRGMGRGQPTPAGQPGSPHSSSPSPQPRPGVWAQQTRPQSPQAQGAWRQPQPRPQSPSRAPPSGYQQQMQPGFSPGTPPAQWHQQQQMQQHYQQQQMQQQQQQMHQQFQQMQIRPGSPQRAPPPGFVQPVQQQRQPPPQHIQQQQAGKQLPPQKQQPTLRQPPPQPQQQQHQKQPPAAQQPQKQPPAAQQPQKQPPAAQQPQKQPPATQQPQKQPSPPQQQPPVQQPPQKQPSEAGEDAAGVIDLPMPRRKQLNSAGTAGRKILIETNHLALSFRKLDHAIHYDVVLVPDTPKKLLRAAIEEFRQRNYPNRYPAFDGRRNLYSSTFLPFGEYITGEVTIMEDDRAKQFKITIKFATVVDLSVLSKYFEANLATAASASVGDGDGNRHMITPQDAIQCLDVVLRSAPALHCTPVGRSFFTKPQGRIIDLGDGMEMYYGFYQSAILGWKPFLNVDIAHKAFPKEMKVVDLIKELCPQVNVNTKLSPQNFETVDKFMRTLKVQYEIPGHPASRRVMRVNQLDRSPNDARFRTDDNKEMTVAAYFENIKTYKLHYPNLPCLWVGSRNRESRILFPVELCTILAGQVTNRAMTANQTSAMIKVAATSTTERKNKILQSIRASQFNQDPSAREFGISVCQDFAQVPARVLEAPNLSYKGASVKPQKGTWRAATFTDGKNINKWAIVCVDDRTRPPALQEFSDMLIRQAKPLGMNIAKPQQVQCLKLSYRKEKQELEQAFQKLKDMELIVVVINEIKEVYNAVKQAAELSVGALTQCVKGRNVFRPKPPTIGNILLKINAKLNGVNHRLGLRPKCLNEPCMIMGADVTHPSPESKGTVPSVAAVTASHDPNAFQYNICWRLQPPTQEIITDLAEIVRQHLMFFYIRNNKQKPQRIIFFRDGVSEGQFQAVLNAEVNTIRKACTMVQRDGTYKPKITFLVVQKRHHTRFFPMKESDSEDRNFNVPAGTIVDTEITHPTALDFYLVSHASIQGVARPTKYRMLWDDNDMNEDELEQLTFHLCHMFTRCTRSVSYPAPTYYAHLAAARAKVYCERRHINMDNLEEEQRQLTIKDEVIKDLPMFFV